LGDSLYLISNTIPFLVVKKLKLGKHLFLKVTHCKSLNGLFKMTIGDLNRRQRKVPYHLTRNGKDTF